MKKIIFLILLTLILIYKLRPKYEKKNQIFSKIIAGSALLTSRLTVVSIYFELTSSKHSKGDYDTWSMNFFKSISSPLVLFTDYSFYNKTRDVVRELNLNVTFYLFRNNWDCLKLLETARGKSYFDKYNKEQYQLDPEKSIHNPNLYAIWNSKIFLTNFTAEVNPYHSEYFIFTDTGAWREGAWPNWPDQDFVSELFDRVQDRIIFGQISDEISPDNNKIQGGFFAVTSRAIHLLAQSFYDLHDRLIDEKKFVGKEQNLMNELAFDLIRENVTRLKTWSLDCNKTYDIWFFYQVYLAAPNFYFCKNDKFSILL